MLNGGRVHDILGRHSRWLVPLGLFLLGLAVFIPTRGWTHHDYYMPLADAFLHGRLYIENPPRYLYELAHFEGRAYVIFPPLPAVLFMPEVAVWGGAHKQVWSSLLLAALGLPLAWLLGRRIGLRREPSLWMALLLGFGTTFWYTGSKGSAWYVALVTAVLCLLLTLIEWFGRRRPFLIGLLLGLAVLARVPTLMGVVFFVILLADPKDRAGTLRRWVQLGFGLAIPAVLLLGYNYARFHDPFTMGYSIIPKFLKEKTELYGQTYKYGGKFDLRYLPRHIYAILFQPPIYVDEPPYFLPSWMGMGLFFTTPAFLCLFGARLQKTTAAALLAVLLIAAPIVFNGSIGDSQFGYRYSLDFTPFLLVILASAFQERFGWRERIAVAISILVNTWGVLSINVFHVVRY